MAKDRGPLAISDRELQIVKLVFEDESEQTIAARLGISELAVHTHLKHLSGKFGVKTRQLGWYCEFSANT